MSKWFEQATQEPDRAIAVAAAEKNNQLTKPAGSLGVLEDLAIRLSAIQSNVSPAINTVHINIYAADHGVVEENISAFPQVVTAEMVRNFSRGGAAISVLAKQHQAALHVYNVGTVTELESLASVYNKRIAAGTKNFAKQCAMTEKELLQAFEVGKESIASSIDCFIAGEMGIGNTTTAAALATALTKLPVNDLVGRGTGLDSKGVAHKAAVISAALTLHEKKLNSPIDILCCLGGFEIAAMVGAYITAAQQGVCILVDGFICSVAAMFAIAINPSVKAWMIFSHQSEEAGHCLVLQYLGVQPLLNLGMRLGEGSGAAVALPLLKNACDLHNGMASFADAGVSQEF